MSKKKLKKVEDLHDDFEDFAKKFNNREDEQPEAIDFAREKKKSLRKKINDLSQGAEWNILEDMLQDIQAEAILSKKIGKAFPFTKQVEALKEKVNFEHKENEAIRDLLLEAIPSLDSLRKWIKKPGWKETVERKIKENGIFSTEKKALVFDSFLTDLLDAPVTVKKGLYELYFKLSGDLGKDTSQDNAQTQGIAEFRKKSKANE